MSSCQPRTRAVDSSRNAILFAIALIVGVLTMSGCAGVATQNTGLNVLATDHSVSLSWNPSTSVVAGYRVYRSLQSGAFYTLLTSTVVAGTSFEDLAIEKGKTYYYVVTAVDAQSNESAYSNEVFATVPAS
jgi:fibronectin type 3 domain-containing protein